MSAPAHFSNNDWLLAGGVISGTMCVIFADNYLYREFSIKTEDELPHSFWTLPTYYGELKYAGIFSAGMYSIGLVAGEKNIRVSGRLLLESLLYCSSTLLVFRYVTGRSGAKPNGAWDFKGFQWNAERQSFPSGHTMIAFALSTVLAERIDHPLARIGLYSIASLTAYSRVRFEQHWTSDVLVGGVLGIATGLYVITKEREREEQFVNYKRLSIAPTANGLCLLYTF